MPEFTVTEVPRNHANTLVQTDSLAVALDFVEQHVGPPSTRLVLWWPAMQAPRGPDAAVAVPLTVYEEVEVVADRIVDAWNRSWLLIDSTAPARRDPARDDLVGAIAAALISAAVTGLDEGGDHVGI